MTRKAARIRRGAFVAAAALSLAFGPSTAAARPAEVEECGPKCNPKLCDRLCRLIGAFSGTCTPSGGCACAL
ncbi:MAG TPA: hypothetical protein VNP72_07425 [Longimicrobium sp.]|nr:hypothetical protein [Longimicrobium sp.]